MPAKTKHRNRKNKTRRHNNKTRRPNSKLAKLMKGGQETFVDNDNNNNNGENLNTQSIQQTGDSSFGQPDLAADSDISAEVSQEGSVQEPVSVSTEPIQVEESTEQNIDMQSPSSLQTQSPEPEPEYKYNNLIAGDVIVEGIEQIPISKDDITVEDNISVLGTPVPNTNYYIDLQGVRREFKEGVTSILKVNIVELPTLEGAAEEGNKFLTEANTALTALGTMLQQIYGLLPEYMEVDLDGKRYIISKQNPYIVVDNEQPPTAEPIATEQT